MAKAREDYKMLRVTPQTWLRLVQFMASLTKTELQQFKAGSGELPGRVTVNDAISILLDRQDAHRARSARSSAKRRQSDVNSVNDVNDNAD